jgi:hypothetical protein
MPTARTIVVLLVALSIAILPAARAGAFASQTANDAAVSETMAGCCHHADVPCDHAPKPMNDCPSMAACAAMCLGISLPAFAQFVVSPLMADPQPLVASKALPPQAASPPFRPPRS